MGCLVPMGITAVLLRACVWAVEGYLPFPLYFCILKGLSVGHIGTILGQRTLSRMAVVYDWSTVHLDVSYKA